MPSAVARLPDRPIPREPAAPGRLAGPPVAIIDIGSNSVRLVIYEAHSRAPTPLYNEKLLCGLGRGVATSGRLPEDAVARALEALARFRILCTGMGVGAVTVLATAAARDAANGAAFLRAAEQACGYPIELLSGEREAALSAAGVVAGFHAPDGVVGDLGGGSLELVDLKGRSAGRGVTFPLGGLVLRDLAGDSQKKAARLVRDALEGSAVLRRLPGRTFYAVGGTWRSLAKLQMAARDYPLRVLHGYELDLSETFLRLVERSGEGARKAESITEARRPLLAYGAIVLDEIIRIGRPARVTVSALGVREGLLYDGLDPAEQVKDPLLLAAGELNLLRSRQPGHAQDLIAWTDGFFASLHLDESDDERRLRHAACLLADTGWRAHPDYRGEQSLAIIAHAAFLAIDHPGRAYLALAIYLRHAGLSLDRVNPVVATLASTRLLTLARLLAALLRVAYPLSITVPGVLARTPLGLADNRLVLRLPPDLGPLASERLESRLKALGRMLDREAAVVVG